MADPVTPTTPTTMETPTTLTVETTPNSLIKETAPVDPAKPVEGAVKKEGEVEPKKEEGPAPVTFEALKIPEGLNITNAQKESFLGIMNDPVKTGPERAQALIDLQTAAAKEASESMGKNWEKQQETWQNETKADPIIGGDKLEPALGLIDRAIETYRKPEDQAKLRSFLAYSGGGNNQHVIGFIHHLASLAKIGEGTPVPGGAPGTNTDQNTAQKIYTNSNMK